MKPHHDRLGLMGPFLVFLLLSFRANGDDADFTPTQMSLTFASQFNADMRVTWISKAAVTDGFCEYGTSQGRNYSLVASAGNCNYYNFPEFHANTQYTSGCILHVELNGLDWDTKYYYRCGRKGVMSSEFSFKTRPQSAAETPFTFALIGDLGQTNFSEETVANLLSDPDFQAVILAGDLSYADNDQKRWDSWGNMMQPLTTKLPILYAPGNHEIEAASTQHFIAYQTRFKMPSNSNAGNLYYSLNIGSAHVVFLCSYCPFSASTDQYEWLKGDLKRLDRSTTPWLLVVLHAPWYNSNTAHHNETEEYMMRDAMETLLYKYKVDVIFAGHVHAYERVKRVYQYTLDDKGPVYINIGDGGNREGLASNYYEPMPFWSAYRRASYGHGKLEVVNSTHAFWAWKEHASQFQVVDRLTILRNI